MAKKEINTEALVKLLERAFELAESQQAVLQEMRAIIGGELGIGAKLRLVYDGFSNAWRERYSRTVTDPKKGGYVWNYAKEGPAAKRLLQKLEPEEIVARAARYIRSADAFYLESRHSFLTFASQINRFAPATTSETFDLDGGVADCRHLPPCRSDQEHTRKRAAEMRS